MTIDYHSFGPLQVRVVTPNIAIHQTRRHSIQSKPLALCGLVMASVMQKSNRHPEGRSAG
jgi:hypothetical protein